MKRDDGYTSATKQLIKKTLIGLGISALIILVLAVWAFKKITGPKEVAEDPEPSVAEVLAASTDPTPTESPSPSPSVSSSPSASPSATLTASPSPSTTLSPSPSATQSIKPSPTPQPSASPTVTPGKTISSQSNLDGYQSSNGAGSTTAEIKVGRNNSGISRGFISFDITQIPFGSTVDKTTLRIYQSGTTGNPYSIGGEIKIDHLNYGSTFESSDYGTSSISSSFSTISGNASAGWREVEVTQNIKGDLTAGRVRSQFRLHYAVEQVGGSSSGDYALFESGENAVETNNVPQLVVLYH